MAEAKAFVMIPYTRDKGMTIEFKFKPLVMCRDCVHRPIQTKPPKTYGFSIEFPEGSKCPCQCADGYYSWYPEDHWFCASGESKENKNEGEENS